MHIGFVRHGKTDWNAQGIIQGQTDIPLNEEGITQARALAARLVEEPPVWDAVLSSDLERARVTAEIIASALNIPLLEPDSRLRERGFGLVEGTTEAERLERWGADWREREVGMESDADVRERGKAVVADLLLAGDSPFRRDVLIVSHGSFIAQMLLELCAGLEDKKLGNLAYSVLKLREQNWQPLLHNCTKHLERAHR